MMITDAYVNLTHYLKPPIAQDPKET